MEVQQAREARNALAEQIRILVKNFEEATQLTVDSVYVHRVNFVGSTEIDQVVVEVRL